MAEPLRISRRAALGGLSALVLAAPVVLRPRAARAALIGQPFAQPALYEGRIEGGRRVFDLNVAPGVHQFLADTETATIGINGGYLGPILSARAGDALRMNVANGLAEPMTIHWHGMHLPASADGGPHQEIAPAATWSPEFDLSQRAGTFWYHGHQHHKTGAHVWAGMAGVIRVSDDEEETLALPRTFGEDDFTLVLQDRRFDASGQMPYDPNMHDRMAGLMGDVMLVNGLANPLLEVDAPRIRLRILNGSNGSIYRLHFSDGRMFHQIASDGGLLDAPVPMREAMLAPGERGEVVLDVPDGAATVLRAEAYGAESQIMGSSGLRDVMEIRPKGAWPAPPALPARLAELPEVPEKTGETRHFRLDMSGQGMMGDPLINGVSYDHGRVDFAVPVGSVETWVWQNASPMLHPIHIHDVQFRITARNGQPPAPHEAGLKDTVLVYPGETVKLRLRFDDFTDPVLPYMYHCHILEHEDAGMMGQFTVV